MSEVGPNSFAGTPATTVIPSRTASISAYGAWKKVGIPA
jgi:hypothetical protein